MSRVSLQYTELEPKKLPCSTCTVLQWYSTVLSRVQINTIQYCTNIFYTVINC